MLLSVFVIYSLRHQVKLNWTAPVWLAAIPLTAWDMVPRPHEIAGSVAKLIRRLWLPTIIGLLIIHGAGFYYLSLGLPGAGPVSPKHLFAPWRLLGEKVAIIEATIEAETKSEPVIVGMDKNFISSELSFYAFADHKGVTNTGGPHFFGERSLMWEFWLPASAVLGRNFLMIDFDRRRLSDPSLSQHFDTTSDVSTEAFGARRSSSRYFLLAGWLSVSRSYRKHEEGWKSRVRLNPAEEVRRTGLVVKGIFDAELVKQTVSSGIGTQSHLQWGRLIDTR